MFNSLVQKGKSLLPNKKKGMAAKMTAPVKPKRRDVASPMMDYYKAIKDFQ